MSDNPTRRTVLKTAGSAGVASGLSISTVSAADTTTEVIEAGVEYSVPGHTSYDAFRTDSRPAYTVNQEEGELILLKRMSKETRSEVIDNPFLANEQAIRGNSEVALGPSDGQLNALPVRLTTRMRVNEQVPLEEPVKYPNVVVHTRGRSPAANVASYGRVDLSPGQHREIKLDPVSVTVRTKNVYETTTADGQTKHEREFGTAEVKATPVVKLANHGELDLERQV